MSELSDLLIGVSVLLGAASSAFALIWTTVRSGRKPEQVARSAADEVAAGFLRALADGELSADELTELQRQAMNRDR